MCHVAVRLIDRATGPPHGAAFWYAVATLCLLSDFVLGAEARGFTLYCLAQWLACVLALTMIPRRRWGHRATAAYPHFEVTTKHSYAIHCKFVYQCTNKGCGASFSRHSKSVDTVKKVGVSRCSSSF